MGRRALLFDYDGLIVDSETMIGEVLIDVFAQDGVTITFEDFAHLLGTSGPQSDALWDEWTRSLLPNTDLAAIEARMTRAIRAGAERLTVLPGVRELIDEARAADWAVGLGTGNTGPLDAYLERLALSDAFDAIVRSHASHTIAAKPAPDVFLALADRLGSRPDDCVVLEDSVPGAEAAIAAGMAVIICPSRATRHCDFPTTVTRVDSLADVTLDDLHQLATRASARPRR